MSLRLEFALPPGPLRRAEGARVSITLTNDGPDPVVINRRMAPGYVDSVSREVYFDLDGPYGKRKYDRNPASPSDYGPLDPAASVTGNFDLLAWYRVSEPGTYRLTAHYQCDEPSARAPEGVVNGVVSSSPRTVTIE